MTTRIKLRRDTAANWLDANPILSAGEPGVETDSRQIKYGDGVTPWRDLDYANTKIKSMTPVTVTTQDPHTWVNMIGKPKNACLAAFLAYDSQGNLLVASQAYGGATGYDSPLVNISKFDEAGNTIWSRDIPSNEFNNYAGGVAVDSLDNVYVAISIWNGSNYTYGTVLKLAGLDGATRWIESFDNNQYNWPAGIDVGPDDQPVVIGTTGGDHNRGFAIKFNSASGDITQAKIWNSSADTAITGMAIDSDNNVIISGLGYNTDTDTNFALVQKLDPTLTPIWTKSIPTVKNSRNNTIYDDGGGDVAVDAAGNIFLTGYFVNYLDGGSSSYIVVMKLNSDGIIQWSRDIRGDCDAVGNSITVGQDGLVYLAGYTGRLVYVQTNVETVPLSQLLMACYAPDTGKVLWQRTMDTPDIGFTAPGVNFDTSPQYRAGSCIAVMGDRLALCGSIEPVGKNGYDYYNWGNIKAWALQIPANGELVDISGWRLEEGSIPGRYQSFATVDYTGFGTVSAFEWGSGSNAYVESNSALAVTTLLQDSNSWKFGTNGDLKLPDDGDLDIGKRQVGWINLQGHKVNYDHDVEFQGICVDTAGNSYGFGYDNNDGIAYVVKYDADGGIVYQKQLWYPPADSRNPVYGNIEGGVYDQTNDRVVMIVSDYNNGVSYVVAINALTGDVFSATKLDMGATRFDTYDIDLFANGNPVVVGKVGNGFKTHALTPLAGAAADYYNHSWMDVNVTDFAPDAPPQLSGQDNWKITGTGIVGEQYTYGVNYYDPLTATPVPGLGATFNVTVTSATYASVAVVAGGTGYKSGDVIIILGTSLGGVSPANDLQLTVDAVDGGVIIGVSILGGTATGADAVYTAQPGITQVGTGATFYLEKYEYDTGPTYNLRTSLSGGSGYKSGDILKLLGSQTGGVNTTNDIIITVNSVDGGGAITVISSTGLVSLATVRLIFDLPTPVNFGDTTNGRAWQLGSYTGGDAVLWTATWHNIFGVSTGDDQAESVAVNKNTGDIFVGGTTYNYTPYYSGGPTTWVAKFNSAGARQWVMNLDQENGIKYNSHIALDSNGDVIVCCYSNFASGRDVWKLKGTDGTPQWRTMTDNENIFDTYDGSVAVDGDDNIIVTGEDDYSQWIITKIDTSGIVLWQNRLRTANWFGQQYQNNGTRWTAIYGDHLFTGGTTDAVSGDQDYNGFLAKLPLTGEGTDGIDDFDYQEIQIPFNRQTFPTIQGEWAILVVNATTGITSSSVNMISVPEVSYETTTFPVLSATGGGIVFGDGTRQETSASLLKQRLVSGYGSNSDYQYTYKIRANDAGKHILLTNSQNVWLPSWHDVEFPVGTKLTIINWSGNTRRVYYESGNYGIAGGSQTTYLSISGGGADYYNSFLEIPSFDGGNVVTLIKIRDAKLSDVTPGGAGDVTSYWIATGTSLSFND